MLNDWLGQSKKKCLAEIIHNFHHNFNFFPLHFNAVQLRKVTLVNHSSSSCFKEVEPLSFEAKQELHSLNNARKLHTIDSLESEDLLTSERTRFRPIKQTFADGYAFDISNKLDHINYERSKSGLLYHNSEVYREYYLYDEDGNGGSSSRYDDDDDGGAGGATSAAEFTLKYCIRQNDKSCQTDDAVTAMPPRRSQNINDNWFDMTRMRTSSSNSCVPSSTAQIHPRVAYYETAENNGTASTTSTLDKLMDVSQDGWCLDENRLCCNNNNITNNNNNNNNSVRALWEHCATCSMDVVSMPANRQLKEELSADGDEIMRSMNYLIQSISFQSDWDDDDTMTAATGTARDDNLKSANLPSANQNVTMAAKPKIRSSVSRQLFPDVNKLSSDVPMADADDAMSMDQSHSVGDDDFNSDHIYSNVSKLIMDLLQPEKAQTLVQAISEKCQGRGLLTIDSDSGGGGGSSSSIQHTKDTPNEPTKTERMCNTRNNGSEDGLSPPPPPTNRNTNSANNDSKTSGSNKSNNCSDSSSSNNINSNNGHFGSLWAYNDNSIWRKELPATTAGAATSTSDNDASAIKSATTTTTTAVPTETWEHAALQKIWNNVHADTDVAQQQNPASDILNQWTAPQTAEPPSSIHTDKTINYTEKLNENSHQPTQPVSENCSSTTLAGGEHSKSDMNTLEKFWHLIKQANALHDGTLAPSSSSSSAATVTPKTAASSRYDRKRRHSATSNHQNYFDHCSLNNCDAFESIKKLATKTITDDGYGGDPNQKAQSTSGGTTTIITCKYWTAWDQLCVTSTLAFNNNNNNNVDDNLIVADGADSLFDCYRTAAPSKFHTNTGLDTINANDSILMQPTSTFLKQMAAMVSRPLTR